MSKGGKQRTRWTSEQYQAYLARTAPVIDKREEVPIGEFLREKDVQQEIYNWLLYHEHYFIWHRMDRRTTTRKGVADFNCCVDGRWIALEVKIGKNKLSEKQEIEAARLRKAGGKFVVVRSREEAIEALTQLS